MFPFSVFLHFAHLLDSLRARTTKQEKVLSSMVYFYDHVLVQYALKQNMAEEGVQFKIM